MKPKTKKAKTDKDHKFLVSIARRALIQKMKAVGKERDELRQLRDDVDALIASCDDAKEGLDTAIEALSRYV